MDVDEEIKTDKEPVVIVMKSISRSVVDRIEKKKKEKYVPPNSLMKDFVTKKDKTPKGKYVTKRRKVGSKDVKKKSLNRKLV